jgi:hypothetical protein
MASLETQYKRYLEENPESTFTYEQWLKWHSEMLSKGLQELKEF